MNTTFSRPRKGEKCWCGKAASSVMVDRQEGEETIRQPECEEHANPKEDEDE